MSVNPTCDPDPIRLDLLAFEATLSATETPPWSGSGPRLEADLETFMAADAIQWAAARRQPDALLFRTEEESVRVLFEDGLVWGAESSHPRHSFGRFLYAQGLVGEHLSSESELHAGSDRVGLADSLLEWARMTHVLDLTTELVSWSHGSVRLEAGGSRGGSGFMSQPLRPTDILLQASRREELGADHASLQGAWVTMTSQGSALLDRLPARWRRALELVGSGLGTAEHRERLGGSRFQYFATLSQLAQVGLAAIHPRDPLRNSRSLCARVASAVPSADRPCGGDALAKAD